MATQQQIALQMVAQLRVLDPSASAEIGSPERKILDTVAQALAESQVDLNVLSGGLDLDSKFGADLDRFLGVFGFGRQKAVAATGFVTFYRVDASNYDIPIPSGTRVMAPGVVNSAFDSQDIIYQTTSGVTLSSGDLSISAPIECLIAGTLGNVAANTITEFGANTVLGITSVNNVLPVLGGQDVESDDEYKLRFRNTFFRNLSGTNDQFLALSVSTAFTTKANVVGPISRYREYIQVPDVDDATADPDSGVSGNGSANEFTSGLSSIPFSKHIYDTIPYFILGDVNGTSVFFRQDTDYYLNTLAARKDRGDAYRTRLAGGVSALAASSDFQPNITFKNIYTRDDVEVQAIRAKDIVLFEHSYMSTASRNDWERNITNCVDVYINGENETLADAVIALPSVTNLFTSSSSDAYYFENFRRVGEPNHRPVIGNILTPLFWSPVLTLPDSILVGTVSYLKDVHYWVVKDISPIGSTVRARDGIEWAAATKGVAVGDDSDGPYTGAKITASTEFFVAVDGYTYDKNVNDLQVALETNKQTTTDVLGHSATSRYFKLDLTVMYNSGVSITDTNLSIRVALDNFFEGQYFGTTIQLSDLLQVVHNVSGVDNVRWSKEILDNQSLSTDTAGNPRDRLIECDIDGNPLVNIILDRVTTGDGSTVEVWHMYLTGTPTGGTYRIGYSGLTTTALAFNAVAGTITTALGVATIPATVTSGSGTAASPFVITFSGVGARLPQEITTTNLFTGGISVYNADFFLEDDQLPALPATALAADTLAGLIIRPRAQNVWNAL